VLFKGSAIGLRLRLLLLVLFAVIPAIALIGSSAYHERQQAAQSAERDTTQLVRLAGREQTRLIDSTRQLLISLAQLPEIRHLASADDCSRTLARIQKQYPYYTNIGVATLDGRLLCNSRPITRAINIADRGYFRRAVESQNFSIGEYQISRVSGLSGINFGYPVLDPGGKLHAVIYAALNLSWLNELVANTELPPGSIMFVIDSGGTVLARYPDPGNWVGKGVRHAPLVDLILNDKRDGIAEMAGLDGVVRLNAFTRLHQGDSGGVYLNVGIPREVVFANADITFKRDLILLLVVVAFAVAAAWVGSDIFVLRRVNALTDAAQRLAKGDLSARSGLPHGNEELGQLARSFDDMAVSLQRGNNALKTLSAGNRALVRAQDEESLLVEMCRVIVEVGGYPFSWIGFAEQDESKSVRPVAMAGIENGMEELTKSVSGLSWGDNKTGQGAVGAAIRSRKPVVACNFQTNPLLAPWREEAARRGYGSVAAFPLYDKDQPIGALAIYTRDLNGFDTGELELLDEAAGDLAFGIGVQRARAEHEKANATITRMAYYDSLTGLPNHTQFDERLRRALLEATLRNQSMALFVIGLNRLREINDALGFNQGDLLLNQVGIRIRGVFCDDVLVARMRGDEFAVLLPTTDDGTTSNAAQQIVDALKAPFAISNLNLDVSAAIGISLFPEHGIEPMNFLRHADVAMQQAKKAGKSFVFYAPEHDQHGTRRLSLAAELRRAIEGGELVLYYQPKIDMRNNRVCGAEALVRWNHPVRGMVPPDEFITLAEHTGLIKPLTDWVVNAALRQSASWRKAGLALPIAVNLSARNLHDVELVRNIDRLFAVWGAESSWLELEITEGAVMEDPEGALDTLQRLSAKGMTLFIDDFGTGYSSLGYLKKLPMDAVKIDKSFVCDMLTDTDSAAIVRSTIGLAHDLDLKVVAEGIESQEMWNQLAALGCDVAQGYHISRPLPAEKFIEWLHQRHPNPVLNKKSA